MFAETEIWDAALRVKLGGCLIGILLGHLTIKDSEGRTKFAVEHDYIHNMDKTVLGILRAQDAGAPPPHPGTLNQHTSLCALHELV